MSKPFSEIPTKGGSHEGGRGQKQKTSTLFPLSRRMQKKATVKCIISVFSMALDEVLQALISWEPNNLSESWKYLKHSKIKIAHRI